MLDMKQYDRAEAIEELLDDCDLTIATLDAEVALKRLRIQFAESKLKLRRPASRKIFGYLRITRITKEIFEIELKRLAFRHRRDVLHDKLRDAKQGTT